MGTGGSLVVIDFSERGNSGRFRRDGWSGQETDRVWGVGPRSVLMVPIQSSGRPIVIEAELAPALPSPVVTGQLVRIGINGIAIGGARIGSRTMIRCEIDPPIPGPDGTLEIEFGFPGFCRPDLLGVSTDDRPLSCWFSFVRVYTKDMYKPGPWFPPSHPNITVIGLSPPLADTPDASIGAAPSVYTFGRSGTVLPFLRDGWHGGEDNYTWTDGSSSQLELPAPPTPGFYVLRLDASSLNVPEDVSKQYVTILLDGIVIGQYSLREPSAWVMPLPRELTEGRTSLPLTLIFPDPRHPADIGPSKDARLLGIAVSRVAVLPLPAYLTSAGSLRAGQAGVARPIAVSDQFLMDGKAALPAAVRAALGIDSATLMRGFESLGTNSEFGVVQRKLGLEVLNLFRFCETTLPDLTKALSDDLRAADAPELVTVEMEDAHKREYTLALPRYKIRWQMSAHENDSDRESLRRANAIALGYLRRKFYEGLRTGRKIYVLKRARPIPTGQAAVLLMELNRCGSATLLCVEVASNGRRPGEVELLMPGLMRGYIARFAPDDDVESADPMDWLPVLANAALLKRRPDMSVSI